MQKAFVVLGIAALLGFAGQSAFSAEITVDQKGKNFTVPHLQVKVGDKVQFRNSDPYFHNVFSMSDAKTFDLGSYPQGKAKSVTFDQEGTVEVECAIHPAMKMTIEVTK